MRSHDHILFIIMPFMPSISSCHPLFEGNEHRLMVYVTACAWSWFLFSHVCSRLTRHYLHALFLISHFKRFLSLAGNRKMKKKKKQALAVDESEIEKWKEVRLRGMEGALLRPQTRDGNQSLWRLHKSADHIVAGCVLAVDAHALTQKRHLSIGFVCAIERTWLVSQVVPGFY